ncbi:serine/threonine-protein kinase [Myxococcus sp. RHSTA-1-4]|uniref:serine/threonine-protein kinase n=1 Tax=Myxococcus sp. RHSTA-1-4 TaxID=2874601 RepID=UPI001CBCE069|nr:serine/threonine-protein kinase [Myxococcus sp. RHSTA-1-4]MBZ4414901.1 serine/threonine protein kinase [Myxococcus sp. RHSTA-1-4]
MHVAVPRPVEVPSRRFGRYLLRTRLGSGGMAEVFLADAVDLRGQPFSVALKLMRKDVPAEVFADEADLMGLLEHPNLVQLLEVGEAFGRPFIAMELLVGGDLGGLMRALCEQRRPFPPDMAVHVCLEVLRGLAYFHRARTRSGRPLGLVHGDVNPANVFFSGGGEVKLGDFGVARARSVDIGPADGVAAGKLHYLSPEQTRGEPLTPASDVFAVGIVLHELLLGRHPFRREETDPDVVMTAIRGARLSLPDTLDRTLAAILRRALAPDVVSRYHTAGELAGALLTWSLDTGNSPTREDVRHWLADVLGLIG